MRKFIISVMVFVVSLVGASSVFAETHGYSSTGKSFTSSWTVVDGGSGWSIQYGYNTDFINEDFTYALHGNTLHTAIVENNNGQHYTTKGAGIWANVEVVHSGSTIFYEIRW